MSERKSINKYYPPDFDPSKVTRRPKRRPESASAALQTVRLMAPFSMRCTTCGEFIYKGKKFNARKQPTNEDYHGIKIIRFYIRCPRCAGEIRFKTDPKISDYRTESGAERNREPWRDTTQEEETLDERLDRLEKEEQQFKEKEEREKRFGTTTAALMDSSKSAISGGSGDAMKDMEDRMNQAKREMEVQDELEELQARNARVDLAAMQNGLLDKVRSNLSTDDDQAKRAQEEKDAEEAKNAFRRTTTGERIVTATPPPPPPAIPIASSKVTKPKILKKTKRVNSLGVKRA